jgi:hypothetical protein
MEQQSQQQQGVDFGSTPNAVPEYSPETSFSPQGGLLGRLLSTYAEQSRYQPFSENDGQAPPVSPDPNFRQLARVPNGAPRPMDHPFAPPAEASAQRAQYETDQAQLAREAAARLARGVRNLARAEAPPPDPIDIAKSAGIGVLNGGINAVGLPADVLAWFGSDHLKSLRSDEIRHWIEQGYTGEFYQPKSRAGRYAETIGEMVPALLAGEGLGVLVRGIGGGVAAQRAGTGIWAGMSRGGQAAAAQALPELPWTLAKHAVVPGAAVQTLEEAFPESQAGQTLQKAYPVLRSGLPVALATKRYFRRQIVPQ